MADDDYDVTETSGPVVRYSVKELFSRIDQKLDVVVQLAESKASQVDLDALESRVDHNTEQIEGLLEGVVEKVDRNESRIQSLEEQKVNTHQVWKIIATIATVCIGGIAALAGVGSLIFYMVHG